MINTVIFDLGGVLVDFHPIDGMRELGFDEKTIKAFKEKIFSGVWEECDRFPYENQEIRQIFKKCIPEYEKEVDILWDNISVVTSVNEYTDSWIKRLKEAGMSLYVLSNYGKQSFLYNSIKYDFLKYMDGMVISYQHELLKPDPELYEILLNKYNINKSEAVFIDDRQINVDGAKNVGLNALLFDDYCSTKEKLDRLMGK